MKGGIVGIGIAFVFVLAVIWVNGKFIHVS